MDHRVRFLPVALDCVPHGAAFGYICLDEMKIGVMQKRNNRFSAEEKGVDDCDPVIKAQQFRRQDRADISGAAGDQNVALRHSSPSRRTLYPSRINTGADLSLTTKMPCSRQVSLQISATSPEPAIRTRSYPARRIARMCSFTRCRVRRYTENERSTSGPYRWRLRGSKHSHVVDR